MRWFFVGVFVLASGTLFASDGADVPRENEAHASIEWAAPARDVVATAGEELVVAWRPRLGTAVAFQEWEVFLSLDGGTRWPYRLTPHLDRRLSRFVVELPPVASRRARLLLRYGNEREERELVAPFELTIAPPSRYLPPKAARLSNQPGESARSGQPGVVGWVDGPRGGSPLVRVESGATAEFNDLPSLGTVPDAALAIVEGAPEASAPAVRLVGFDLFAAPARPLARRADFHATRGGSFRLALLGRRNE